MTRSRGAGVGRALRRRSFLQLTLLAASGGILSSGAMLRAGAQTRAKVIIVGGGFAGATCALALRRLNPTLDVTLMDPDERYVTCPMSNGALVGLRNLESLTVSRVGLVRAGVKWVGSRATSVDAGRRLIRTTGGGVFAYDRLVMAPGIRFLWGTPQGYTPAAAQVMPHAWQAGEQTRLLAGRLRDIRDGGVVAISVPAGPMRCPPGPFERASLIAGYLQQRKPRCKVLIFDANNHFPRQDVFSDAWAQLYPGMIEWIPVVADGAVTRVATATMTLYTSQGAHRVDVANIIPPQAPAPLAVETGLAAARGWCPVKSDSFESTQIPHVHVIGDACIADPMPKSASAAHSQARQCALAIVASLQERDTPAPQFESVCYSLLAPGRALAIHGRFRSVDGVIEQLPGAQDAESGPPSQEAANADSWYKNIVLDSFGS